jgi:hypothetical protein
MTSFLNRPLLERRCGRAGPLPGLPDFQTCPPKLLPACLLERRGFPPVIARYCLLAVPATLINWRINEEQRCKAEQPLFANFGAQTRISSVMCAGQQMEHTLTLDSARKHNLRCPLRRGAFNLCITISFFPIHLCNRWQFVLTLYSIATVRCVFTTALISLRHLKQVENRRIVAPSCHAVPEILVCVVCLRLG